MTHALPQKRILQRLYVEEKQSAKKIGQQYGVAVGTVLRWLGEHGIEVRKPGGGKPSAETKMRKAMAAEHAMRQAGMEPLEPYPGDREMPWKCRCTRCDEIRTPIFLTVQRGGTGCKPCGDKEAGVARRLRKAPGAIQRMRAARMEPLVPYPGRHKPWLSRCMDCREIRSPRLHDVGEGGCKPCGDARRGLRRRLGEDEAIARMRSVGMQPLVAYPGEHEDWLSQCLECGEISSPQLTNITAGQGGCRPCGDARRGLDRRLGEDEAIARMRSLGREPLSPYPGGSKGWLSRCLNCDEIDSPRLDNLHQRGGGCQYCASHGPNMADPGILYLISNPVLGAHKIGVTHSKSTRLAAFRNTGWQVYHCFHFTAGRIAYDVEKALKVRLNGLGISLGFLHKDQVPQAGHTETLDARAISLSALKELAEEELAAVAQSMELALQ